MGLVINGVLLNQRQLDVITPVLNQLLAGEVTQEGFEATCIAELENARCALGYDQGLDKSLSVKERAGRWIVDGRVGMSSKAIWAHMTDTPARSMAAPSDADDLNRCLLLLDLIPEWAPRMGEMVIYGGQWAGLAPIWETLASTFIAEAGLDWCNGESAPKTYNMMKAATGRGV